MIELAETISDRIRNVLGIDHNWHPLHAPSFDGNELRYLKECIDSTFVSSAGKFVDRFESELASYTGVSRAVSVVSGTAALQMALVVAGVSRDDEVLVPALSFVATANAVSYTGAIPHFVDVEAKTLGMDPLALRAWLNDISEPSIGGLRNRKTGRRIHSLVPMHTFGHPADIDGLLSVAHDYKLTLIEDSAESLGSTYHGRHVGTFGLFGILSFNGNKVITTGGGGAILTNNNKLADRLKHITTTAKIQHPWEYIHDEIGYNFRMPNLNAALGCAQLERLPDLLASKRRLYQKYRFALADVEHVYLMEEPQGCISNYWLQTLILDENSSRFRDEILVRNNNCGLMSRPAWRLLSDLEPYKEHPRASLSQSNALVERIINIPSSAGLA